MRNQRHRGILILGSFVLALVAGCPVSNGDGGRPVKGASEEGRAPLATAQEAVARARDTLRLGASVANVDAAPGAPGLDVSRIPFVAAPQRIWRLHGRSAELLPRNKNLAAFDVTLDADTGALVAWQSVPMAPSPKLGPPIPDRASLERFMIATGSRYVGFPTTPPKLSVPELLEHAAKEGFADLTNAREVRIKRVLMSIRSGAPTPVWIINLRGTTPMPGKGPGAALPEEERSHLRLVYDENGKLLFADNLLE